MRGVLLSGIVGFLGCAVLPKPETVVISWPQAGKTQPQLGVATTDDIQPKPCTLHGTGWAEATDVLLVPSDPPRAKLYGAFAQGVEWNDIPPVGSMRAATLDIARGGVRIHALGRLGDRTFWLARKSGSIDGLTSLRPGRKVTAIGVEDGEVIVESYESRMHPSRVVGHASCADLGTDTGVASTETPLPGNVVRPARSRWVRFLAQPNGAALRSADLAHAELRTTVEQGAFVYAHARFDNADIEGWVATADIKRPNGGIGYMGRSIGTGVLSGACSGTPTRHVRVNTELRVGPSTTQNVRLGDISAGTTVYTRGAEDGLVRIDIPPCELQPAGEDKFWVAASSLD